ncbi:MAG TPA: hypothetical protein VKN99_10825 [Polyangia bacterium]|nr:hypothetical protein [Polyangia bacterium]
MLLKRWLAILGALATLSLAAPAFAEGYHYGWYRQHARHWREHGARRHWREHLRWEYERSHWQGRPYDYSYPSYRSYYYAYPAYPSYRVYRVEHDDDDCD